MPHPQKGQHKSSFVNLPQKVRFLNDVQAYPQELRYVRPIETHMSWIFLTDVYVYKLKKPVKFPYLDFSSLAKREAACREELRLNRRLAPETYLDVVALTYDKNSKLHLDGPGKAVEWLVKMRRLDTNKMLERLMQKGEVPESSAKNAARHLAGFYQQQASLEVDAFTFWNKMLEEIRDSYRVVLDERFALPLKLVKDVISVQQSFLTSQESLFRERIRQGFVKEGHGDLRPAHICLEDKPVIFDCLEFNRDLRVLDTLDDLAFLDMECDRLRNPEVGSWFLETYAGVNNDPMPEKLLLFYKSKRATLRASLSLQHLNEQAYTDHDKWVNKADDYLSLAKRYTDAISQEA